MAPRKSDIKNINITSASIIKIIIWGLVVVALFVLRDLVLTILTAIVIASFVGGSADRLEKHKINRTLGSNMTISRSVLKLKVTINKNKVTSMKIKL